MQPPRGRTCYENERAAGAHVLSSYSYATAFDNLIINTFIVFFLASFVYAFLKSTFVTLDPIVF